MGLEAPSAEVEFLSTSLASKIKSLAPKPANPRKCPVLGQHYFWLVENGPRSWPLISSWSTPETSRKMYEDVFFFWRTLARCVLGLKRFCPRKWQHFAIPYLSNSFGGYQILNIRFILKCFVTTPCKSGNSCLCKSFFVCLQALLSLLE